MINWTEILSSLLTAVVTAAVPVIAYSITSAIKIYSEKLLAAKELEAFDSTLKNTLDLITSAVECTSQTYVDALKASGEFSVESQREAFLLTKETVMSMMTDKSRDILQTVYQDLDSWIDTQIEAAIKRSK